MKLINRLGLAGLLTGALSFGALALPQESYAEHKGKLKIEMREKGYSIILGQDIKFEYNDSTRRYVLITCTGNHQKITQIETCVIMYKYGVKPYLPVGSVKPDSISTTMNRENREVEPSVNASIMWENYLEALHQKNVQKEWYDKYFRGR